VNLILLEYAEVAADGRAHVRDTRARHVTRVLGASPGQTLRVGVVDGPLGVGTVVASDDDDGVTLSCVFDASPPARPRVDVLLALPRPKVMRRLWAQLAAIGVGRIILTNAERVERNYFDTDILSPEKYRPLVIEGLQQARDTRVPSVSIHRQFKVLVEDHLDGLFQGRRCAADPTGARTVSESLTGSAPEERVLIAVGPEGGWNAFELRLLQAHGFTPVSMGARTLRTDTACVALLALAHEAMRHRGQGGARAGDED
jgi:RsmE family RNA methyltransferase